MKPLRLLFILFVFNQGLIYSQGVGVGTTTPDPSAALEVSSVTQGMLVPRMTTTQRSAITNAANGLLVFDMTTNSFWFKGNGQWIELIDTSNTVVHKTGSDIYMGMGGNVGIGTPTPTSKLEVRTTPSSPGITHSDGNVVFQTNTTATSSSMGTTSNHSLQLFANNAANQVTLATNGYVGINTSSPQQQLHVNGNGFLTGLMGIGMASPEVPMHFGSSFGDKIALYGSGGSYYGMGVANGMMQMYSPNVSSAIGFGYGSSAAFIENMRLTGNGNLGIGTNSPSERLSVNGNGNFTGNVNISGGLAVGLGVAIAGGIAVGGAAAFAGGGGFGGAVSIGAPSPSASAQLDVSSTTKGFLQPRMTTSQRDAIPSPPEGLTIYNTDTHSPNYRDNEEWKELKEDTTANHEEFVFRNGNFPMIYMGLTDNVGVGTNTPSRKFQVKTADLTYGVSHTNGTVDLATYISSSAGGMLGTITDHPLQLFSKNGSNQFVLTQNGNIGIGTASPHASLQFSNTEAKRKIVLKEIQDDDRHVASIGVTNNSMRYQVPNELASHLFYAASTLFPDTANTLIMQLRGDGNVGIGASPLNRLDVHSGSSPRTGSHPNGRPMYITGDQLDAANGIEFRSYNATEGIGFGKNTIYAAGNNANQNIGLAAKGTTGAIRLLANGLERMYITGTGNVGIGTVTPNAALQLGNLLGNRRLVLWESFNNDHQYFGFGINGNTLRYQVSGSGDSHIFYAGASASASTELFRITGQGYVGIGVPSPLANLEVARGTGNSGTAMFKGTSFHSHFNYSTNEDTYLRGGKNGANVIVNDYPELGNVGIGTAVPLQKLHVQGNSYISGNEGVGISVPQNKVDIQTGSARSGNHPTGLPLYVTGDIGGESDGAEIRHANGSQGVGIGFNTIYATGNNDDQDLGMSARGLGSLVFKTQSVERMRINANGNVGIGTTSPNAPLQFPSTTQNRKIVMYESFNNDHQYYGLGVNPFTLRYQVSSTSDNHVFYAGSSSTTSNELMRITGSGKVGIGTSTPNAPLQFANTAANRKIVLYENANNDHQFNGIGGDQVGIRYQTGNIEFDHVFYAATSPTTSNELMRIKGIGNIDVAGTLEIGYIIAQAAYAVPASSYDVTYTCDCPPNTKVLGGGYDALSLDLTMSRPNAPGTNWIVRVNNVDPFNSHTVSIYAICARLGN